MNYHKILLSTAILAFSFHHAQNLKLNPTSAEERWKGYEQRKKLEEDRKNAIQEILKSSGLDSIVTFTQLVEDSYQVGVSLSSIEDQTIDSFILDWLCCTKI